MQTLRKIVDISISIGKSDFIISFGKNIKALFPSQILIALKFEYELKIAYKFE